MGITMTATCAAAIGRAVTGAVGECHTVIFAPDMDDAGLSWAGVEWQYPANNWGAAPGLLVPAGATQITFYARGALGGEKVTFSAGGTGVASATAPCVDTVVGTTADTALTTTWTQYTIPLTGTYAGGVLNGFTWVAAADEIPNGAATETFYIDDIEWSM